MIETTDIYRSIRNLLEANFTNISVQIKDKKTPQPPCFYIKYVTGKTTQTATEFENTYYSFEIAYFAEKEELLELLEIEEKLKEILRKPLKIVLTSEDELKEQNQYQEIDDVSITLNEQDYVLSCVISLSVNQTTRKRSDEGTDFDNRFDEYDNEEFMEEIEI
ncbi:MAG: hypothetical protein OSJ27_08590 [Candidatus Gastranaerophilales bacterium]|nr:hypothetical protein [Candidatus Gastranaerophilales bacterium]